MPAAIVPTLRWAGEELAEPAPGRLALCLAAWAETADGPLLLLTRSEGRAASLAAAVRALASGLEVATLPAWDVLPDERAPPSRGILGARMATLRRLADGTGTTPHLVAASSEAASQLLPPPGSHASELPELVTGGDVDLGGFEAWLRDHGYVVDERVDEPGEAAFRGCVVDLFPADAHKPSRIELDRGRIVSIRSFDPATQRSIGEMDRLRVGVAAEPEPSASLFELLPEARILLDAGAEERRAAFLEQVADALAPQAGASAGPDLPDRRYLPEEAWQAALAERRHVRLVPGGDERPPRLAGRSDAARALHRFVAGRLDAGDRVVLAAGEARDRRRLVEPLARRLRLEPVTLGDRRGIEDVPPGQLAVLGAELPTGFLVPGTTLVSARDVLPRRPPRGRAPPAEALLGLGSLRPGDLVVHAEHGIGRLLGLETVDAASELEDHLVLEYADEERLLVPALELDRVWRYGTAESDVGLDRADGERWAERRRQIAAEIDATAARLRALARERATLRAPIVKPPRDGFGRFVRGFPHELTDDQTAAIEATLADLARASPPMDRLVVGDVGFGKTEVALRAAAATVLAGKQVALLAPTTLLVRQHLETFRRRFRHLDVRVEQLSRLARGAEARAVRGGLADGSVAVVIGTHALASPELRFKELGLLVIDEEQRFGSRHKEAIRRLRRGCHVLAMSATPIPRTLQAALAGIRELSLIATAPVQRRPVRTVVRPFEPALVREALERERRRGGRSFVVVPRIADIAPMAERLRSIAPGFDIVTVHGRMKADALDGAVLAFAAGRHDVLLTTSIVEAGLDIPRADTMIVWRPERFGVAQLHQLRGRVGRGRERAACHLLHDPDQPPRAAAARRLQALADFDDLGAGFLVSAHDLDQRGAGDLIGEEQSGHLRLIGTGLYQDLLARALRPPEVDGAVRPDLSPELHLQAPARLPTEYVPEPELRLDLYSRLARLTEPAEFEEFAAELADRFGAPPEPVIGLLEVASLRARCRHLGIARLEAGPKAVAATLVEADAAAGFAGGEGLRANGARLILDRPATCAAERLANARELLDRLEEA